MSLGKKHGHELFFTVRLLPAFLLASCLLAQEGSQPRSVEPGRAPQAITLLEDTPISVRTIRPIDTRTIRDGAPLLFSVSNDVLVNGALAIPRGALVHGIVVRAKKAGTLTGSPELILKLTAIDIAGHVYPITSYHFKITGTSKTRSTEGKVAAGATVGAIAGASVSGVSAKSGVVSPSSRTAGMAAGAVVGAGVGTLVAAAGSGPAVIIPAEAEMDFALAVPVNVLAVDPATIKRLAWAAHAGDPVLYVRGETP